MDFGNKLKDIRLFVMDVDGVLTNGNVTVDSQGNESKTFSVLDGHGIYLLHRIDVVTAIITREKGQIAFYRARKLNVEEFHSGVENKEEVLHGLIKKLDITEGQTLYIGDDYPDIGPMKKAGVAVAVANAMPAVKEVADYITLRKGGEGAVREVIEMILAAKGYET